MATLYCLTLNFIFRIFDPRRVNPYLLTKAYEGEPWEKESLTVW
jgi:hypothetical protein